MQRKCEYFRGFPSTNRKKDCFWEGLKSLDNITYAKLPKNFRGNGKLNAFYFLDSATDIINYSGNFI